MTAAIRNKNALTENKPPPIRRIRISDFRLPDLKRDLDRHQNCITWSLSHALPLQKISSKSVHKFASRPNLTDRQTDKQTAPKQPPSSAEVINSNEQATLVFRSGNMHTASHSIYRSLIFSCIHIGSGLEPQSNAKQHATPHAVRRVLSFLL